MLKVLGRETSNNVQKVLWLLDELGQSFEHENLGGPWGGNRTDAYLALNPNGTVPTLLTEEGPIWESNAITRYLARRFGATQLYPQAAYARAQVDQWMDWQLGVLAGSFRSLYIGLVREKKSLAELAGLRDTVAAQFALLEAQVTRQQHIAGQEFSLADVALAPMVHRWFALQLDREPLPALRRYYELMLLRPAFQSRVAGIPLS
jgi:glutathione S-transferase